MQLVTEPVYKNKAKIAKRFSNAYILIITLQNIRFIFPYNRCISLLYVAKLLST